MPRRFIQQLADGDTLDDIYLVGDKQLRANRQGNLYLQLELRDRTGAISARLWNASEQQFRTFEAGDFLLAKGKVQLFQGALQVILSQIDRRDCAQALDEIAHGRQADEQHGGHRGVTTRSATTKVLSSSGKHSRSRSRYPSGSRVDPASVSSHGATGCERADSSPSGSSPAPSSSGAST